MKRIPCCCVLIATVTWLCHAPAESARAAMPCGPEYEPADFAVQVDNIYFPMAPRTDIYVVEEDEDLLVNEISVTGCTVMIDGVECTVI